MEKRGGAESPDAIMSWRQPQRMNVWAFKLACSEVGGETASAVSLSGAKPVPAAGFSGLQSSAEFCSGSMTPTVDRFSELAAIVGGR